jgi:hypothetical protein
MAAIKDDMDGTDWKKKMSQRTVDEAWNFLTTTLQETIERNIPKGQHRTKFKHPWMNREILRLVCKKRRAWRNYKFTASLEDRDAYKRIEKETANKVRNAKRRMEKELARNKTRTTDSSPKLLQDLESSFLTPLVLLFNKSVSTGEVPLGWKTATVCPIFKKGTKGDPGNYRPVSLTSVTCKLLESIIMDKITEHLIENGLIRYTQHGFIPGKSCATNLVEFMDTVTRAADEGKAVDIFYLDFAKAFDKVPRQRLLNKTRAKGIHTGIIKWIEAWLTGRTQWVSVQGEQSEEFDVESGVPQGTGLGPTLFTIYTDDLEAEIERRKMEVLIKKFADDTKGAKIIQRQEDSNKLQEALDCLCEWADKWVMSFNYGKCKVMYMAKTTPGKSIL